MKKIVMGVIVMSAVTMASAHGCPGELRAIDAKVSTTTSATADMSRVKALREEGEKLHKEGKHTESMKVLAEAKKLLGL